MKKEKEISAWARALYLALNKDVDEEKVIKNLFLALDKKNYLIPAIIKKYKRIKEKESKIDVFIAKEISQDLKEKINRRIENLEGKNNVINYTIEEDLIGGFRIKTKDYLVKASIKDTLTKIKNNAYGYN
ncbi:MAG TPA: F0F1 ATP synthase subunit delta [Candidatus Pacearchaeota archaeon]|nr:F0F1 ATP synthase subunit delta [Candidatus Pacearchaeota archaeon]